MYNYFLIIYINYEVGFGNEQMYTYKTHSHAYIYLQKCQLHG